VSAVEGQKSWDSSQSIPVGLASPNGAATAAGDLRSWKNDEDIPLHAGLNNSVSACLMFMDDNHLLVEWLAYHYFVMPLRHVVVSPDPLSSTSPMEVLERWKPYMTVEVWNNTLNLNTTNTLKGHVENGKRQVQFYKECGLYLRSMNRTWTMFTDVDEYWAINEHVVPDWKSRMQEQGAILRLIDDIRQLHKPNTTLFRTARITRFQGTTPASFYVFPIPDSILTFLFNRSATLVSKGIASRHIGYRLALSKTTLLKQQKMFRRE
jgi:hypothetical protein